MTAFRRLRHRPRGDDAGGGLGGHRPSIVDAAERTDERPCTARPSAVTHHSCARSPNMQSLAESFPLTPTPRDGIDLVRPHLLTGAGAPENGWTQHSSTLSPFARDHRMVPARMTSCKQTPWSPLTQQDDSSSVIGVQSTGVEVAARTPVPRRIRRFRMSAQVASGSAPRCCVGPAVWSAEAVGSCV